MSSVSSGNICDRNMVAEEEQTLLAGAVRVRSTRGWLSEVAAKGDGHRRPRGRRRLLARGRFASRRCTLRLPLPSRGRGKTVSHSTRTGGGARSGQTEACLTKTKWFQIKLRTHPGRSTQPAALPRVIDGTLAMVLWFLVLDPPELSSFSASHSARLYSLLFCHADAPGNESYM